MSYTLSVLTFLLLSLCLYFSYRKVWILFSCLILCFGTNNISKVNDSIPTHFEGRVVSVKSSYVIVKTNDASLILYTKDVLSFNDTIQFTGDIQRIKSVKSKTLFNFEKFMNRQNIFYSIKANSVKVIHQGKGLKASVHRRIKMHDSKEFLNKVLLNINDRNLDSSLEILILSSGLLIRYLLRIIINILKKFFLEGDVYKIDVFLNLILTIIFRDNILFLYLLLTKLVQMIKIEQLDQHALSSILILMIHPQYLFSLSFIVTTLFRFGSFIQEDKKKIVLNMCLLIPLQLMINFRVSILNIIMFPYTRFLSLIIFLLALIDLMFFTNFSYLFSTRFLIDFSMFSFTGHMTPMLLVLWVYVSLKTFQKFSILKCVSLLIILILNQNQLLFNPSVIYTQIYVGQGDSAVLKMPFKRKIMMIDTGSQYQRLSIKAHLDYYGIKTIKSLIISHDDEDHAGNLNFLSEHYNIEELIKVAGDYKFYNLDVSTVSYTSESDNDASLISSFSINNNRYLSLGDVSKHVEEQYIKDYGNNHNIVKMSHHGSNTGTSTKLLESSSLKLLLNSSGLNNMYNHPHPDVLKIIHDMNQIILDTQVFGDLEIIHFFNFDFIKT